jgi:hypothetical protein
MSALVNRTYRGKTIYNARKESASSYRYFMGRPGAIGSVCHIADFLKADRAAVAAGLVAWRGRVCERRVP